MGQILLNDLLGFSEEEMKNVKIKFNQSNGIENPVDLFKENLDLLNN
ncbi:hypothetical protein [Macrococcus equipercicus]|uniref:Uncharacterized protein n=1 Tax=Macrococcus equipercicus TaxID=69967 RepID=A0A9Q9F202_9STAP|nr:hypothetical protein [Macrococcus equipercicus]UTH13856.1 hypothetical protein KFV11_00315 [Macrococcus equipercicus]